MNNQRVLRLGMGWIRLGLLMIGLVIGLGGDLLAQGTAQTIRGKVLDESGDPLPMASVLVVGTKVGVTTNTKGDFTIKLPAGKNQLLIRFVSYKSQTVTAKDGMVIKLQPEATTPRQYRRHGYGRHRQAPLHGCERQAQGRQGEDGRYG